jgi:hypothetical protein
MQGDVYLCGYHIMCEHNNNELIFIITGSGTDIKIRRVISERFGFLLCFVIYEEKKVRK